MSASRKTEDSRKSSIIDSRRTSVSSSQSLQAPKSKIKLEPIVENRRGSAKGNIQTHPCFQSSLFNDKERAAGSFKEWKDRMIAKRVFRASEAAKEATKDYSLKQVLWAESVKQPRRLTIANTQGITDWEVMILKRAKSYALAAIGDMRGKVSSE